MELVFHPHADTHVDTQDRVEQFLRDTDPQLRQPVPGHRAHLVLRRGQHRDHRQFPERITYVHLKQVDPVVRERVRREKLSLAEAVPLGVMSSRRTANPGCRRCWTRWRGWTGRSSRSSNRTCTRSSRDIPLPIQARAAGYFVACGLGPVRRWPY